MTIFMKISQIIISVWLFFMGATTSPLGLAQNNNANPDATLVIDARLVGNACLLSAFDQNTQNNNVFILPPMTSTTLDANAFGPVVPIELNFNKQLFSSQCDFGSVKLVFDSDFAAVSPRTGLLRNSAKFRPAENVFLQIGLIDKNGEFSEINLNQPQSLNQSLSAGRDKPDTSDSPLNIAPKLGVRYVTSRAYAAQLASSQADPTGSKDVTAGNISVYLPFLLKVN
jgi:hypothetical protein